jgi:DNA-binding NarL/FixJ family response regulator
MQHRILLADDHEIVRKGLRAILAARPDWEICGEASNGREAIDEAKRLLPDLVIMDIGMPGLNGLGATRHIIRDLPGTEVLILTMHQSEQIVWELLDAGARGFVLKSDAGRDLIAATEALLEHKLSLSGKISEIVLRAYLSTTPKPDGGTLSVREQETLELLAEGKSTKEIAEALHISVKTAETHRSRLMKKLKFRNIAELMRYAVRKGIIAPGP